jgi:hypothetical protein
MVSMGLHRSALCGVELLLLFRYCHRLNETNCMREAAMSGCSCEINGLLRLPSLLSILPAAVQAQHTDGDTVTRNGVWKRDCDLC